MSETIEWNDQKLIYNYLERDKTKGYTAGELEEYLKRPGCHRRLSEMETMGLARKSGKRTCRLTGKKRDVWFWDESSPKPPKIKVAQAHRIKVLEDRVRFLEKENAQLREQIK